MGFEDIILSEISQTAKDKYCMNVLTCESEKPQIIATENRLLVVRGWGWHVGEMGEGCPKVQTFSHKINKF